MKKLIFLRHAKSSWEEPVLDRNRSLSSKGIKAVQGVSHHWKNLFDEAECIFTSPANRALHSAKILAHTIGYDLKKIRILEELYTFNPKDLLTFIKKTDDSLLNIIIVGHNPAFSVLSQKLSTDNAPALRTSCWTQLTFQTNKWSFIEFGTSISGSRKSLNF
tara:strand:- start:4640 stop:5125 length:486 start_codon:yes stop_codon:yes gene_type:complete